MTQYSPICIPMLLKWLASKSFQDNRCGFILHNNKTIITFLIWTRKIFRTFTIKTQFHYCTTLHLKFMCTPGFCVWAPELLQMLLLNSLSAEAPKRDLEMQISFLNRFCISILKGIFICLFKDFVTNNNTGVYHRFHKWKATHKQKPSNHIKYNIIHSEFSKFKNT